MDESRVENLARASSENGTATVIGLNRARNVVQVSAAVSGEERCVTRQITAAWETTFWRERSHMQGLTTELVNAVFMATI